MFNKFWNSDVIDEFTKNILIGELSKYGFVLMYDFGLIMSKQLILNSGIKERDVWEHVVRLDDNFNATYSYNFSYMNSKDRIRAFEEKIPIDYRREPDKCAYYINSKIDKLIYNHLLQLKFMRNFDSYYQERLKDGWKFSIAETGTRYGNILIQILEKQYIFDNHICIAEICLERNCPGANISILLRSPEKQITTIRRNFILKDVINDSPDKIIKEMYETNKSAFSIIIDEPKKKKRI